MQRSKKEKAVREKKNFEMFETLTKSELHFIKGGDDPNKENGGDQ